MSQPTANGRMFSLDLGKLFAAFIVAIIHLTPCTKDAEHLTNIPQFFAVPLFVASALHFTVRKSLTKDVGVLGALSLGRVAVPYFAWTALYLLMRLMKNGVELFSVGPKEWFGLLFLGQSAVQLYFLPLLVFYQLVAAAVVRTWCAVKCGRLPWGPLAWLLAALAVSTTTEKLSYFGWSHAFAGALVYTVIAVASNHLEISVPSYRRTVTVSALLVMAGLALVAGVRVHVLEYLSRFYPPVFGLCALLVLMRVRLETPRTWVEWIVSCYFGIYLMHHAFEEGAEVVLARLGHPLQPYTLMSRFAIALIVCVMAVVITLLIRRHRTLAYVLLGERTSGPLPA